MAELWNRVDLPFPSAASSVRVNFSSATDSTVKSVLVENEKALKLVRSELLQTEVRVLYELLYILNNSFRGNKTFKGLKQVEQCINRLRRMKLEEVLQELMELCPNRIQRGLGLRSGECDVPTQPFLEWVALRVLGAAELLSCTLSRCSRTFLRSRQQMRWEEFVILNVVVTSMLSRLWVICRGLLLSLSSLYQHLLQLLSEVACSHPMPFLTDFQLPADMSQFLGPSHAPFLSKQVPRLPRAAAREQQQGRGHTSSIRTNNHRRSRRVGEDVGVAVERGAAPADDLRPPLGFFSASRRETQQPDERTTFQEEMRGGTTVGELLTHLDKMITWCRSQRMTKEKRLLAFLRLKCRRLSFLEAAGHNVQKKLQTFRQEALWASSPQGPAPRSCRSSAAMRRKAHLMNRFHSLRSQWKCSAVRAGVHQNHAGERRRTEASATRPSRSDPRLGKSEEKPKTGSDSHDDIDDIFASVGL